MLDLSNLIYLIPGSKTEEISLNDGEIIESGKVEGTKQHIDVLLKLIEEYKIKNENETSIVGIAQTLAQLGIITIVNIGKIDGKYAASIFLPEELTYHQIDTVENLRETFENNFHHKVNFFEPCVYAINTSLTYKLKNNCFRDLYIESIINGRKNNSGIELLYQEIETQKENKPRKNM